MNVKMILAVLIAIALVAVGWYYLVDDSEMSISVDLTKDLESTVPDIQEGRADSTGLYPGIHKLKLEVWLDKRSDYTDASKIWVEDTLWVQSSKWWGEDGVTASISFPEFPDDKYDEGWAHMTLKVYYDGDLVGKVPFYVDADYETTLKL